MVIVTSSKGVSVTWDRPIVNWYWNTHQWCKLLQPRKFVELNGVSKK